MDKKVAKLINEQINKELYSAYLYLSFADFYEEAGLKGYANWYMVQVQEERDHALIMRNYMHSNNEKITLLPIDQPDKKFDSFLDPLVAGLEHEKYVTSLINNIYAAASKANDYRTMQWLDWFVKEQLEEEENAQDMIDRMKLFGDDKKALYDLDQEYAARTYTQAAPLANNA
ncbi:MAG: ferritin [Coriobacteriales bacterium]|jgi:ferritin